MDDISTSTLFIALGVLIFLSAYFSSSETGMMSINRYRLKHLQNEGNRAALRVQKLLERPDRLIGLILIGNNLVNIAASSIATIICTRLFGDYWGFFATTFGLTLVLLIFAEVTPKTLAALYPEKVAFPSSVILLPLLFVLYPFVALINSITNSILFLLRINPTNGNDDSLSREELRTVVYEAGTMIPKKHQDMLVGILDLENVTAEDIMVPRAEIVAIDINDDWKKIQKQLTHAQHTRVLLYRDSIDDAVGFVHCRDALRLLSKDQFTKSSLLRAVREIYFTPESTPLHTLMYKFQAEKERIALVVDEYGDIMGLVTLEDILEEIIGDFTTSMVPDHSKEANIQQDGSVLVDGSANVRDLNKEMDWKLPVDGPKTLNGLILEYLEEIPENQVSVRLAGYPMEIVDIKDNMVKTVRILPEYFTEPRDNASDI
ncbi:HlyC/CorC family transporter [Alteromonas sp. RKMC-009]|uniref:HlyC/CorC family transporter n=1 Tax=Alteromonas sp. RKMC-009 TaxID=2267264 RepID=UPI000C58DA21|nr:HlyC/CorC family transporter [Alteromonas sp. RKMC-009]AYA63899.1 HlyC/CorC family transporter [Alteromonas sp. RKMC-009]MBT82299.1 magnesium/cobalt efflux protein [Alteromonadaceae bacterium]